MRRLIRTVLAGAAAAVAVGASMLTMAGPASAASLQEVTNFGSNPSNLRMHLYVPDRLAANPALLVANHYCTGTGPAFYSGTRFAALADQYGFIVIYPSATRSGQCFDVSSPQALTHNGGSDPVGIVSMVRYVQQRYGTDPNRTFATGASSGGMMTNVLLGAYPDVFRAGSSFMGVPFACFATTDGSGWNSQCAQGQINRTPQAWGDLVRNAYPGYTGPRPRMQLFHGTTDDTLRYPNFTEAVEQWTNVHGLSQTPAMTDSPQPNWTRTRYGSSSVQAPVEGVSVSGVGHSLPLNGMAEMAVAFLGLDGSNPPPTTPVPTTPVPTTPVPTTPVPTTPVPTTPVPTTPVPTTPPPGGGGCTATTSVNQWNGGFVVSVRITVGGSAINGWRVATTLPGGSAVTNTWSATPSGTSGSVTFTNVNYNGRLNAGQSTEFGFQGTGTAPSGTPACTAL